MTEALENSEELLENSQQTTDTEELSVQIEKRGRGRPKGSVDRAPRKRTKIIEEAVEAPPPAPAPPAPAPPPPAPTPPAPTPPPIAPAGPVRLKTRRAPAVSQPAPIMPAPQTAPAPLSPRTIFKQASETIYQLQSEREHARRQYWAAQIEKSLR